MAPWKPLPSDFGPYSLIWCLFETECFPDSRAPSPRRFPFPPTLLDQAGTFIEIVIYNSSVTGMAFFVYLFPRIFVFYFGSNAIFVKHFPGATIPVLDFLFTGCPVIFWGSYNFQRSPIPPWKSSE